MPFLRAALFALSLIALWGVARTIPGLQHPALAHTDH